MFILRSISTVKLPFILTTLIFLAVGCENMGNDIEIKLMNCTQDNIRVIREPINVHVENDTGCYQWVEPYCQSIGLFADGVEKEFMLYRTQGGCQGILTIKFGEIDWESCLAKSVTSVCHESGTLILTEPSRGEFEKEYIGFGTSAATITINPCP